MQPIIEPVILQRVQNDTGPDAVFNITRATVDASGNVTYQTTDLSGATAVFVIKSKTSQTVTNTGHQTCSVDNTNHQITYSFQSGDLPDAGGEYECDLRITKGGKTETPYGIIRIVTRPVSG